MRFAKSDAFLFLTVLLWLGSWAAYHAQWFGLRPSPGTLKPAVQNTESPVAEYREVHFGVAGETGRLLTIDRSGLAILKTLPLGPGSKTMRTHLSCAELVDLPEAMGMEFRSFRSSYGQNRLINAEGQEEIAIVDRWDGSEKAVIWHNPPSNPKPPEGNWAHVVVYFEDLMRRAEEAPEQASDKARENVVVYSKSSSGIVGTYNYSLSIDKSGHAVLRGGLAWAAYARRAETQLTPDELSRLMSAIHGANFSGVQECYGRHAPVNEQSVSLGYDWDGKQAHILWMSPPADPKPPEAWFLIVGILDPIWVRAESGAKIHEALYKSRM